MTDLPSSLSPSDEELSALEKEIDEAAHQPVPENPWDDPLEVLWQQASIAAKPKKKRITTPSAGEIAEAHAKRLREVYSNPENWERVRGVALIDRATQTLLGNFSEYRHLTDRSARKFIREHQPISVEGTEIVEGYLGAAEEEKFRAISWDKEQEVCVGVQLDELLVESPAVLLRVFTRFGGIVRVLLSSPTQFACPSGNVILQLPAETDIWRATSTDTKVRIRGELK